MTDMTIEQAGAREGPGGSGQIPIAHHVQG